MRILILLSLPFLGLAIGCSQEKARMSASNNLKQLGVAAHNYEDASKILPPGSWGSIPDRPGSRAPSAGSEFDTALSGDPSNGQAARVNADGRTEEASAGGRAGGEAAPSKRAGLDKRSLPSEAGSSARRVKYTGYVTLAVKDLDAAQRELVALVERHHGYIAQSDIAGSTGSKRGARWRIRVPVEDFNPFVQAAAGLGIPQRQVTDSEDVTAEYVDLETRVRNKKQQEDTLRGYLKDRRATTELKDILLIEQELARVHTEIEQMEGQLRLLTNLTDLTTVTVSMEEDKDYVPPQAPGFSSRISGTFQDSVHSLAAFGQGCLLASVAIAPWLPLVLFLGFVFWKLAKRARRPLSARPATPPEGALPVA